MRGRLAPLALAGCLASPGSPGADGAPPEDGGAIATCSDPGECLGGGDADCSCGKCAVRDLDCDSSGLRYSRAGQAGGGECVPSPAELALGLELSCVRWTDGRISCWGDNCHGALGDGTGGGCDDGSLYSEKPHLVRAEPDGPPFEGATALSAGSSHVCAIRGDGSVWCWGDNTRGTLGANAVASSSPTPLQVMTIGGPPLAGIAEVAAGAEHTCAVDGDQAALCWGSNDSFQLGTEAVPQRAAAAPIEGPSGWLAIQSGGGHTCATGPGAEHSNQLYCWGQNVWGQLGNNGTAEPGQKEPQQVVYEGAPTMPLATGVFALGNQFSCAGVAGPGAFCWGYNLRHALGDQDEPIGPDGEDAIAAREMALALTADVAEMTSGYDFACARLDDGTLYCWGANAEGQLGIGGQSSPRGPIEVALDTIDIDAGFDHMCAITPDHAVLCWGRNLRGQLGNGTTVPSFSPTEVLDLCQ